LINDDQYSSLLYAEYALELSDLDMYFKKQKNIFFYLDYEKIFIYLFGVMSGALALTIILKSSNHKKKKKKKK